VIFQNIKKQKALPKKKKQTGDEEGSESSPKKKGKTPLKPMPPPIKDDKRHTLLSLCLHVATRWTSLTFLFNGAITPQRHQADCARLRDGGRGHRREGEHARTRVHH
jgi:hypothetical protein